MVFFILCIAILNLGLGYGLALYLHGHGGTLRWPSGFGVPERLRFLWPGKDPDEDVEEPADSAPPQEREQPLPPIGEAPAAQLPSADESQCERMLQETRRISETSDERYAAIGTALAAIAPASIAPVDTPPLEA